MGTRSKGSHLRYGSARVGTSVLWLDGTIHRIFYIYGVRDVLPILTRRRKKSNTTNKTREISADCEYGTIPDMVR
eukprot:scaffold1221_cov207-Amphora_coffeaeformis.AAC.45